MKSSHTIVSVIVIVAVLVFSYAVGLLIRQARTGSQVAQPPVAGSELPPDANVPDRPLRTPTKDTPQERTRVKDQRAKVLEQMDAATEEQKEQFRNQMYQQVGGRRGTGRESRSSSSQPARQVKTPASSSADLPKEDVNRPAPRDESR